MTYNPEDDGPPDPLAENRPEEDARHVYQMRAENEKREKKLDVFGRWYWKDGRDF